MSVIHNERAKLLASALNSLGVGAILAGSVALGDPSISAPGWRSG